MASLTDDQKALIGLAATVAIKRAGLTAALHTSHQILARGGHRAAGAERTEDMAQQKLAVTSTMARMALRQATAAFGSLSAFARLEALEAREPGRASEASP